MGMAASQVRLLQLTSRSHDIGRELQHLSLEKTSLTREMRSISQKYNDALSSKTLMWSQNSGADYVDLCYSTLMEPGAQNKYKPILLSDMNGNIIVDDKYAKYAKMISSNGSPGGDWESVRSAVLSELTGISVAELDNANIISESAQAASDKAEELREQFDKIVAKEPTKNMNAGTLAQAMGAYNNLDLGWVYNNDITGTVKVTTQEEFKALLNTVSSNVVNFLYGDDVTDFNNACEAYFSANAHYITGNTENDQQGRKAGVTGITGEAGDCYVNIHKMFDIILSSYEEYGGTYSQGNSGVSVYLTRDTKSTEWQEWKKARDDAETAYNNAYSDYMASIDSENQVFTADIEQQINFYDMLFTAIAENGWREDGNVRDREYMNQMLQNNQYCIMTMNKVDFDECEYDVYGNHKNKYEYSMDIASNFDNIYSVNDARIREEALTEYTYRKAIINEKEQRVDTRMKNLETENSAIQKMIDGINKVKDDNSQRTFSLFT